MDTGWRGMVIVLKMGIEDQRHETGCAMPIPSSSSSLVACQPASLSLSLFFSLFPLSQRWLEPSRAFSFRLLSSHAFTTLRTINPNPPPLRGAEAFLRLFSPHQAGTRSAASKQFLSVQAIIKTRGAEHIILVPTVFLVSIRATRRN